MMNESQIPKYQDNNILSVLAGLLIGCLAGAVTMLLLAPQSGKNTRIQLQEKGIELRGRTSGMIEDAMSQVRLNSKKFTQDGSKKAKELLEQGQALVVDQLDHVSEAAQAGKKAIQSS
jgi:gas vesicle protein